MPLRIPGVLRYHRVVPSASSLSPLFTLQPIYIQEKNGFIRRASNKTKRSETAPPDKKTIPSIRRGPHDYPLSTPSNKKLAVLDTTSDLRESLGYLAENVLRQHIVSKFAHSMSSKRFNSLREIVGHVQLSLNLTNEDRDDANSRLTMLLTEKYEGFESAMRGTLGWEQMDGISRCMHWISRARESTGFHEHRFHDTGEWIWQKVEEIRTLTGERTPEDARLLVANRLEELDSDLALFSLQLLLRPTLFKPPDKHVEFAKWNRPVLEVEGDMIGGVNSVGAHFQIQKGVENVGYTEIFKDVVVVDGCEVKLNWKALGKAKRHLTHRVELIDAVITVGFNRLPVFNVYIAVPNAPPCVARNMFLSAEVLRPLRPSAISDPPYVPMSMYYSVRLITVNTTSKFAPNETDNSNTTSEEERNCRSPQHAPHRYQQPPARPSSTQPPSLSTRHHLSSYVAPVTMDLTASIHLKIDRLRTAKTLRFTALSTAIEREVGYLTNQSADLFSKLEDALESGVLGNTEIPEHELAKTINSDEDVEDKFVTDESSVRQDMPPYDEGLEKTPAEYYGINEPVDQPPVVLNPVEVVVPVKPSDSAVSELRKRAQETQTLLAEKHTALAQLRSKHEVAMKRLDRLQADLERVSQKWEAEERTRIHAESSSALGKRKREDGDDEAVDGVKRSWKAWGSRGIEWGVLFGIGVASAIGINKLNQ